MESNGFGMDSAADFPVAGGENSHRGDHMPAKTQASAIRGTTMLWKFTDGPQKGSVYQHVFHDDGSVEYWDAEKLKTAEGHKPAREKEYGALKVSDDVYLVSYLGQSGYTLTVALNFQDQTMQGFASGAKEWYPLKGSFEVVKEPTGSPR
jgi:hypothetical protein